MFPRSPGKNIIDIPRCLGFCLGRGEVKMEKAGSPRRFYPPSGVKEFPQYEKKVEVFGDGSGGVMP